MTAPARPTRVDAYLDWMRQTQLQPSPEKSGHKAELQWVFLLLELREPATAFATRCRAHAQHIRVPDHYARPPCGLEGSPFCTAIVSPEFLNLMAVGTHTSAAGLKTLLAQIERFELGCLMSPWATSNSQVQTTPTPKQAATRVVIGVIDDGLAFANARFCYVKAGVRQSRFLALWDQDAATQDSSPASPWHHGKSHTQADLNRYLQAVDENQVYAQAQYQAVKQRVAHGTHVLDLACGADPHLALDNAPAIVGVQLPLSTILDTSCTSAAPFILDGLRYVLRQADGAAQGGLSTTIINLSFGDLAGPHDGSSLLERAFDDVIERRRAAQHRCHIVMAAGNSYLSRCHARITVPPGQAITLPWHIQPDDATPNFLELWPQLDNGGAPDLRDLQVTLTAPSHAGKDPSITVRGHSTESRLSSSEHCQALVALHPKPANGDGAMGLLVIAPSTQALDTKTSTSLAPCGDWMLTLHNHGRQTLVCQAYIQRDDISYGRPRLGRQSFFNDPADERWDTRGDWQLQDQPSALVQRCGTLNSLACGRLVDVVGSVDALQKPASYSSAKECHAPDQTHQGHHLMAITDDTHSRPGILASGTRNSSVVALRGTSMAAPQLTRALAQAYLLDKTFAPPSIQVRDHDGKQRGLLPMTDLAQRRSEQRRGL